jgi:hypothetical protein
MFEVPVALVIFNRPQATEVCFKQIRRLRPKRLFIIGDGAREHRPGEAASVEQCREIVSAIDWDCTVTNLYSEKNMGCGQRISSGISEAMKQVDRLIILEDDCLAEPSFFTFCEALLTRYEFDERVMAITGNNFQLGRRWTTASYYFSKYPHCWGWATWKRAWEKFDMKIPNWPMFRDSGQLATHCRSRNELEYWTKIFDSVHAGKSQSWAFPWVLAHWYLHKFRSVKIPIHPIPQACPLVSTQVELDSIVRSRWKSNSRMSGSKNVGCFWSGRR